MAPVASTKKGNKKTPHHKTGAFRRLSTCGHRKKAEVRKVIKSGLRLLIFYQPGRPIIEFTGNRTQD
jgi:hypothetical protein